MYGLCVTSYMSTILELPLSTSQETQEYSEYRVEVPKEHGLGLLLNLIHDGSILVKGFQAHPQTGTSSAQQMGVIQVGDELLEVDGLSVFNRTFQEVIQGISQAGSPVPLVFGRGSSRGE